MIFYVISELLDIHPIIYMKFHFPSLNLIYSVQKCDRKCDRILQSKAYKYMSPLFLPRQRGKFRPRLTELVKENSADKVKELTTSAFSQLPKNVRKAVEILKTLKAVGPATASGIQHSSFIITRQFLYLITIAYICIHKCLHSRSIYKQFVNPFIIVHVIVTKIS